MKLAIFGGSFDPVHVEHVRLVESAIKELGLEKVIVMPAFVAPHKTFGAFADGEKRLEMCRLAFRAVPEVEVSGFELAAKGTSYSYLTCREIAKQYPNAKIYFLLGADSLEGFYTWYKPEEILRYVTLAVCGRDKKLPHETHERFIEHFGRDFSEVAFTGARVSSTEIRVSLVFGKDPKGISPNVLNYIQKNSLYCHPAIGPALALEKPARREHSFRVALMACSKAKKIGVSEGKALLAAALHDCGKYVPLDSPLLDGFVAPANVPEPVLHQYTGAYLAEHAFGIFDGEILDAIRYHTSGREDMTRLGKLVFLSDLLEEGRNFEGVEELRALFESDLDACFLAALKQQLLYLESTEKPVYSLTLQAYEWELARLHSTMSDIK